MASILDYLDWRGDITFAERPFNEVDNLLLAELSYLDFGGIVPADSVAAVPLSDAVAAFTKRTPHADMGVLVPDKIPGLAQKMAASARFRDMLLSGYVYKLDEQTETQFAALCAALPDGTVYAAFRHGRHNRRLERGFQHELFAHRAVAARGGGLSPRGGCGLPVAEAPRRRTLQGRQPRGLRRGLVRRVRAGSAPRRL